VGASLVVCCVLAVPTVCGGGGVPCGGKHIIIIRFVLYIRVHKYKNERVRLARCVVHSYFYASF